MGKRFHTLVAAWLIVALAAAGCGGTDDNGGDPTGDAPDKVSYITAFGAVGRDAFAWVAKEKGYFAEVGIEVDIKEGAGNQQNLTALKSGQVQFAALDFTGAVIQAGKGEFTDWRAVAAVHQQTLISVMTTKDTNITTPKDLQGKTIATGAGSVTELLFPAYARLAGLDPATVKIEGVQATALNGLMASRRVDALGTFLLSRGALQTAARKDVVVLPYSDYLPDLFGNAIITTPSLISEDPTSCSGSPGPRSRAWPTASSTRTRRRRSSTRRSPPTRSRRARARSRRWPRTSVPPAVPRSGSWTSRGSPRRSPCSNAPT
ncbi:ABC transporter substrate-binding protein [Micromonospora krabiensis]|uniref:NitT/TauT family transport system substrate-binding protein n=1 Tax=Micromonospora krabiensis TaxID=307121 RepID=A0A1C3MXW2_9ACTN|nr:ABC transporter substrate-binding protein [Micromonospora krabiensis]SBV25176.1 NitT/TauT family transport system substrate-binding protein [Micromonospora krabiensis]